MKLLSDNIRQILFFEKESSYNSPNQLKDFLNYIKSENSTTIIDFSYAAGKDTLIPGLSIRENIFLDSIPTSLAKNKDIGLKELLKNHENQSLIKIILELGKLSTMTQNLSSEQYQLASIVKAVLAPSKFLLIDTPERELSINQINMVKNTLEYEATRNHRKILLASHQPSIWLDIVTHFISKNESKGFFKQRNIVNKWSKPQENFKATFDFSHFKKAS